MHIQFISSDSGGYLDLRAPREGKGHQKLCSGRSPPQHQQKRWPKAAPAARRTGAVAAGSWPRAGHAEGTSTRLWVELVCREEQRLTFGKRLKPVPRPWDGSRDGPALQPVFRPLSQSHKAGFYVSTHIISSSLLI